MMTESVLRFLLLALVPFFVLHDSGCSKKKAKSSTGSNPAPQPLVVSNTELQKRNRDLRDAVNANDSERVKNLLKGGAKVDVVNSSGITPLHIAAGRGTLEMVKMLLDCGKKKEKNLSDGRSFEDFVNAKIDKSAGTALHIAVDFKRDEIVKELLEYQAKVGVTTAAGETPLHVCIRTDGDLKTVKKLTTALENEGYCLNLENQNGETLSMLFEKYMEKAKKRNPTQKLDGVLKRLQECKCDDCK